MSNKQSSIEWLVEQMKLDELFNADYFIQQAKEMHKKEIMDAWYNGFEENRPYVDHSEDYYNEIFAGNNEQ